MFEIEFTNRADEHLAALTARQRSIVLAGIEEHLRYEADVERRKRKLMQPNRLATWELRVQNLRVYYKLLLEPDRRVVIEAIGVKVRDQVYIGGVPYDFRGKHEDN